MRRWAISALADIPLREVRALRFIMVSDCPSLENFVGPREGANS